MQVLRLAFDSFGLRTCHTFASVLTISCAGDGDCQALTEALQVPHATSQRRRIGVLSARSDIPVGPGQLKEQELVLLAVNANPDVSAACGGSHWCRHPPWRCTLPAEQSKYVSFAASAAAADLTQGLTMLRRSLLVLSPGSAKARHYDTAGGTNTGVAKGLLRKLNAGLG